MSRVKQQDHSADHSSLYNFMVYASALILFLEWIYPVKDVAEPLNLNVFIIYAVFCFLISWLRLHWILSFGLKLTALGLIVDRLFVDAPLLTKAWLSELGSLLSYNINKIESAQWLGLTAMFRTLLFLLLIWLMSYLLYYWFVTAKRMMLFVVLTFIYLGVLDTFTAYDGSTAIIRTFIVAFLALGISNFIKEMNRENLSSTKKWAWMLPVVLVVAGTSAIGYAAPKFNPQWPDPVPFIESYAEDAGIGGSGDTVQKIGYGEDDEQLGGSFVQDDTPVFRGKAEEKGYWRVESKSKYTGKGWETFEERNYEDADMGMVILQPFGDEVHVELSSINVDFFKGQAIGKLPYQYDIRQFDPGEQEIRNYVFDPLSGSVRMEGDDDSTEGGAPAYKALIERPLFNIDDLKASVESDAPDAPDQYTQLPDTLPDRVGELAEDLTEDSDNRYDKAKAIEQYFGSSGFSYQIEDVPLPEEDQDYVDQFLFESQEGYCDNYSTTMAVMLRTLDIPTRWVKGFTPGEKVDDVIVNSQWPLGDNTEEDTDQMTLNVYEVKSSNAHSWVEVFFPGQGWVPFEPTQGFDNPTDFTTDEEQEGTATEAPDVPENDENDKEDEEETASDQKDPEQVGDNDDTGAAHTDDDDSWNGWLMVGISTGVVILGLIIFFTRWRWQTAYLNYKFRRHPSDQTFQQAYHYMLKTLSHKGLPKQPDQTLRSYADKIDQRFETQLMGELTAHYEQMLYSRYSPEDHAGLTEDWYVLMKRILS